MPTLRDLLLGVLLPALIGLIAGWLSTRGETRPWWRAGLAALAVGVGYAACRWFLWGWKGFPPASVFDWLPIAAVGVGVIAGTAAKAPVWLRVAITLALAMAVLLPTALRDSDLTPGIKAAAVTGLGAVLGIVALISEASALRAPISTLAAMIAAGTIASLTLLLPLSSASQAQAVGILCAGLGGAATAVVFTRRVPVHLVTLGVLLLGATLFTQQRFASGPIAALTLLAVSPLGVLLGTLPPLRRHPWYAGAARVIGVLVIAGAGLGLILLAKAAEAAPSASPY